MIQVFNDFFGEEMFIALQKYCNESNFQIKEVGDKKFSILQTPDQVVPLIELSGYKIILTFIRNAYKGFDDDLRIHADNIINGSKADLACVIYLNDPEGVTKNGTAFYDHSNYGSKLPLGTSNEEFDRIIKEDSNDASIWNENARIYSKPNRIVVYDANYFHSKFPKEILEGERQVLVCFYSAV